MIEEEKKLCINVFKNNFKYGKEICAIEYINDYNFIKVLKVQETNEDKESVVKRITKSNLIDVYNVKNIDTLNDEKTLYIKTINDSKTLRQIFREKEIVDIECVYNNKFKKWQFKCS
jgi:hypothetical protein